MKSCVKSYWQKLWKTNNFITATCLLWGLYLTHFLHCVADSSSQFIDPVRTFSVTAAASSDTHPETFDFYWDVQVRKICDTSLCSLFLGGLLQMCEVLILFMQMEDVIIGKLKAQWDKENNSESIAHRLDLHHLV